MATCRDVSPKKRKICTGDLNRPIKVQVRTLTEKPLSDPDYDEVFTDVVTVWAAIETARGHSSFNDIGLTREGSTIVFTHKLFIRYSSSFTVTSEDWVEFDGIKYDIRSVENLEERNEFLALYCLRKGPGTKLGNLS